MISTSSIWALFQIGSSTRLANRVPSTFCTVVIAEEVINAKDVVFIHQLREQPVQRLRAVQVLSKGFLDDHLAVCRKPRPLQRRYSDREDSRGQREVDRDGAVT